jgi:hypothetical protein
VPIRGLVDEGDATFKSFDKTNMDPVEINRIVVDSADSADAPTLACVTLWQQNMESDALAVFFRSLQEGDTVHLHEGSDFGSVFELKLVKHEEVSKEDALGHWRTSFLLFNVVDISSQEQLTGEPTELVLQDGGWSYDDDVMLWDWDQTDNSTQSMTDMAEKLEKSQREIQLRVRFLKRLHRDSAGKPQPPKMLKAKFVVPRKLSRRIWRQAYCSSSQATRAVSCKSWSV